jgi:hypothetical protein
VNSVVDEVNVVISEVDLDANPNKRVTRAQERVHLRNLRMMMAEGLQLNIPDEWLEHSRLLDVVIAPPSHNQVVERASGGLNYEVWVRLCSRSRCMVEYAELTVPWDDQIILDSPDEKDIVRRFGPLRRPFQEVLNLRIENTLKFARPGEVVEGVILATGMSRLPDSYSNGQLVPFTLSLYDQYGDALVEKGHALVQRAVSRALATEAASEDLFGNLRLPLGLTAEASRTMGSVQPGTS